MKLLHCADLHLSRSEEDYSFRVLDEIADVAAKESFGALLFAGDVFDSRADLEALRDRFRKTLERLPAETGVFMIPGNHEYLGAASEDEAGLSRFDFGRARLLAKRPFALVPLGAGIELLALPFRRDYADYRDWSVPPKDGAFRVLLAHGTVPGMSFSGPDEEGATAVIDADFLFRFGIDYAALGHIHAGAAANVGSTAAVYPGSARVWREGEEGPRKVVVFSAGTKPVKLEERVLKSAGRFIPLRLEAGLDGTLPAPEAVLGGMPQVPGRGDWVRIEVSGLVEDETVTMRDLEKLAVEIGRLCRRVTSDAGALDVFAGISAHPLALRFAEAWEKARAANPDKDELYRLARLNGLKTLKEILESRK